MHYIKQLLQAVTITCLFSWASALSAMAIEEFLTVEPDRISIDGIGLLDNYSQHRNLSCTPPFKNHALNTRKRICRSENQNSVAFEITSKDRIVSLTLMEFDVNELELVEGQLEALSCDKTSNETFTSYICQQFNIVVERQSYDQSTYTLQLCTSGYCDDLKG